MTVIREHQTRRVETPNAVMITLASPTQGGSTQALWRVDMPAGARGPVHAMDGEQIWTVLAGAATVVIGGERHELGAGDTLVIASDVRRQVIVADDRALSAVVTGRGGARARPVGGDPVVPPWIA